MRIAFIWPHAHTVYQVLPLSFGILYSTIRDQGHDVRMFNLPLEGWRADSPAFRRALEAFRPDLVCASMWAATFKSAVAALGVAREVAPNAVTLGGGNYPTLNPAQAYASGCFDYLMLGESEQGFPEFVRALAAGDDASLRRAPGLYFQTEDGRVVRNKNPFVTDLDRLGWVDYEFIELERAFRRGYMSTVLGPERKLAMLATRGCEHTCHFCAASIINGTALRHYSVELVVREIRRVYERYGVRMIYFMDDNATQDRTFFKALCRGIAGLGYRDLNLELYRGVRLENLDPEMLRLMKRAGFEMVTIAPESGSPRVRESMKKDMEDADIRRVSRMIRDAGLSLQAYFIVGYPGETAEERRESYRLIDELDFDVFSLHKYQAIPGTPTFLKLVRNGQVTRDHTEEAHLIGDELPNYNGDIPRELDREIFRTYAWFYMRKPWRLRHLLQMASAGGLWRSIGGTAKAAALSLIGKNDPNAALPAIREQM